MNQPNDFHDLVNGPLISRIARLLFVLLALFLVLPRAEAAPTVLGDYAVIGIQSGKKHPAHGSATVGLNGSRIRLIDHSGKLILIEFNFAQALRPRAVKQSFFGSATISQYGSESFELSGSIREGGGLFFLRASVVGNGNAFTIDGQK